MNKKPVRIVPMPDACEVASIIKKQKMNKRQSGAMENRTKVRKAGFLLVVIFEGWEVALHLGDKVLLKIVKVPLCTGLVVISEGWEVAIYLVLVGVVISGSNI